MGQQALPLRPIAAHKAEVLANTLKVGSAGLIVLRVVDQWHRQQTELGCQSLQHSCGHIACVRQELTSPAQRTQLQTEPELVARTAALGNLTEVGIGQCEVRA
jgi:hypothetical protein